MLLRAEERVRLAEELRENNVKSRAKLLLTAVIRWWRSHIFMYAPDGFLILLS